MSFQKTRLYELFCWIFSGFLGGALAFFCYKIFLPWAITYCPTCEHPIPPKMYEQVHQLKTMPELTDDQLDELISLEKQIIEHQHNQQNNPNPYKKNWFVVSLFILCATLLIGLSIYYNSFHIISLILAMWGVSMLALYIRYHIQMDSIIFLVLAVTSSIYCYHLSSKNNQLVAVQVFATMTLTLAILLGTPKTLEKLFTLQAPKHLVPDRFTKIEEYMKKSNILHQEGEKLLAKETLTNQEKRRYFDLFKQIDSLRPKFDDPKETKATMQIQGTWQYAAALHESTVLLILISICILLASLIACPMFLQFSLILLAAAYCVQYYTFPSSYLDYTHSIISKVYIVFLALFLCFHLYRQKRYCIAEM